MLISDWIKMKWNRNSYKWYIEKGYYFTHYYDYFLCKISDLQENCNHQVVVQCDYCKKIYIKSYKTYIDQNNKGIIKTDCCKDCIQQKREESFMKTYGVKNIQEIPSTKKKTRQTCLEKYGCEHHLSSESTKNKRKENNLKKYGVENVSQLQETKEKVKATVLDKFGVENVFQSDLIKDKIKQYNLEVYGVEYLLQHDMYKERLRKACLERFGCEYPTQSEEIKQKIIENNLDKYGTEWYMSTNEFKEKSIITNLKKYGCINPSQNKNILAKQLQTLYKNGTQKSSTQQKYISQLLKGDLNYPVGNCSLDILLDDSVFIEYQGSGHWLNILFGRYTEDQFLEKEKRRKYFLSRRGYKQIEIISRKDYLPSDNVLINMIEEAKSYLMNHSWITYDIDNSLVKCSQFEKEYDYGTLRKIKRSDISNIA